MLFRSFQLILVDDGSTDGTDEYANHLRNRYAQDCFKYVRHDENRGVSRAWNSGLRATTSPYTAIVNNDILFTPGWDTALINALEANPRLAVVSPLSTEGRMPPDWPAGAGRHTNPAGRIGYMPLLGACFLCRTSLFDEIGLFPESMRVYWSDNWLVMAVQNKGYECGYAQESYIHHQMCITTSKIKDGTIWANDRKAFAEFEKVLAPLRPYRP